MAVAATPFAISHEAYIGALRDAAVTSAFERGRLTEAERDQLAHTRLMYGVGQSGVRGACYYRSWKNGVGDVDVIEIGAITQESFVQVTGTVLHELAHVLAGPAAGHDTSWKDACVRLGFSKRPEAAGQVYHLSLFSPVIRGVAYALMADIRDGSPAFARGLGFFGFAAPLRSRPCSAGFGTRGGTSRGKGSGSRLRLWECACAKPIKVRIASDSFAAHCDLCESPFVKVSK